MLLPHTLLLIAACHHHETVDSSPADTNVVPSFGHVFVIVMENTSNETLLESDNTPYIHGLIASGASSSNYHGVEHPSLPNYIALASGTVTDNGPKKCDCNPSGDPCTNLNCSLVSHSCGCPQAQALFVDQLEAAGITWRAYGEEMATPCNQDRAGDYVPRHMPFVYFPALTGDTARCTDHVVDYTNFATDLASTDGPRRFTYIAPNLVHDMHDPFPAGAQNLANGDAWLSEQVPAILASPAYTDGGMLIIMWDEDDLSGLIEPDEPIPFILMSPLATQGGFVGNTRIDHYSLLAALEDGFGVPRLAEAVNAQPLTDFFPTP